MRFCRVAAAVVMALAVAGAVRGDDLDRAKDEVEKAETALKRLKELKVRGLSSELEVQTAEVQANQARAALARANGDEAEEKYRGAVVTGCEAILTRIEEQHKKGIRPADDVEAWRKNVAAAKIDLALLRGEQKTIVTQWRIIVAIEEKRLARAKELFAKGVLTKSELNNHEKALEDAKKSLKQAGGS